MEAAYDLAITVTMLSGTILLTYLSSESVCGQQFHSSSSLVLLKVCSSSQPYKFFHGSYFTVLMATAIFVVMFVWRRGTADERHNVYLPVDKYIDQLHQQALIQILLLLITWSSPVIHR